MCVGDCGCVSWGGRTRRGQEGEAGVLELGLEFGPNRMLTNIRRIEYRKE